MSIFLRRRTSMLPRIGEIFSAAHSGDSTPDTPGDYWRSGDDDNDGNEIQGILTEDGIPIHTEDGLWIQAENQ